MNKIHIDGSGWSGKRCAYCVYFLDRVFDGNPIINIIEEQHTNNEMEYIALIRALREINEPHHIFTDSQLVFGHVTLNWKVNSSHLLPLRDTAKSLLSEKGCVLSWIPREQNEAGRIIERHFENGKNRKY